MASRAFTARLRMASSSWCGSTTTAGSRSEMSMATSIIGPSERSMRSRMSLTSSSRATARGLRVCRRAKLSRRPTRMRARSAACSAPSMRRVERSSSRRRRSSSSEAMIGVSRLLKSWAMPPVSWPIISILRASCSCAAAVSRWATMAATRSSRPSFSSRRSVSARTRSLMSTHTQSRPPGACSPTSGVIWFCTQTGVPSGRV